MKLIDVDKLFEAMNERYNEKKDIVSDTLSEGFMQMDKLIHEQEVFDLAEHDKQIRAYAIDEVKQILLDAMIRDGKTKCHEYMVAFNEMEQLKEQKNE